MLPPLRSLDAVEIACPCGGATPKQPIIGASGSTRPASAGSGCFEPHRAGLAVDQPLDPVARRQVARPPRDRRRSPTAPPRVQPVPRTGSTLTISTRSASPGSAPSTKTGPFIGFGGPAFSGRARPPRPRRGSRSPGCRRVFQAGCRERGDIELLGPIQKLRDDPPVRLRGLQASKTKLWGWYPRLFRSPTMSP